MMRWGFSEHDDVGGSVNMMRWGFSYSSIVLILFYHCSTDTLSLLYYAQCCSQSDMFTLAGLDPLHFHWADRALDTGVWTHGQTTCLDH